MFYDLSTIMQQYILKFSNLIDLNQLSTATTNNNHIIQLNILLSNTMLIELPNTKQLEWMLLKKINTSPIIIMRSYTADYVRCVLCASNSPTMIFKKINVKQSFRVISSSLINKFINNLFKNTFRYYSYDNGILSFHLKNKFDNIQNKIMPELLVPITNIVDENKNTMLYYACKNNYVYLTSYLLSQGADPNAKNYQNYTPMMEASRVSSQTIIARMITGGGNPTLINNYGYNSIQLSVMEENLLAFELMIKLWPINKTVVNHQTRDGQSVFNLSKNIANDKIKQIVNLYNSVFNINISLLNENMLKYAVSLDLNRTIKYFLLESKINISSRYNIDYLYYIVSQNDIEKLKLLIKNGINIKFYNSNKQSVLHLAIRYRYYGLTKLLIDSGLNINGQDVNNNAPIHFAAFNDDYDIIKLLIDSNVDINIQNNSGTTALHIACKNCYVDIANLLVETEKIDLNILNNACINQQEDFNSYLQIPQTAFDIIITTMIDQISTCNQYLLSTQINYLSNKYLKIIDQFIKFKADIFKINSDKNILQYTFSNMMKTIYYTKDKIIYKPLLNEYLLNIHKFDHEKNFMLYVACCSSNINLCQQLLISGANPNIQYESYYNSYDKTIFNKSPNIQSPFYTACMNGDLEICKLLLSHNADINLGLNSLNNIYSQTPLYCAIYINKVEICELLLINNANVLINDILSGARECNLEIFDLLIKFIPHANIASCNYDTLLSYCSCYNSTHFDSKNYENKRYKTNLLFKAGCNINIINNVNQTILWNLIEQLCEYDPYYEDDDDDDDDDIRQNQIHDGIDNFIKNGQVQYLIDKGIDVNIADNDGENVLWIIDLECNEQLILVLVNMLIEAKININKLNNEGESVIWNFASDKCFEIFKLMVKHGANLNIKNNDNMSLIEHALDHKYIKLYEYLFNITNLPIINNLPSINSNLCGICLTNPNNIVYFPCKHLSTCDQCDLRIRVKTPCLICKKIIDFKVTVFNT